MDEKIFAMAGPLMSYAGTETRPRVLKQLDFEYIKELAEIENRVKYKLKSSKAFISEFLCTLLDKSEENSDYPVLVVVDLNQTEISDSMRASRSQVWKAIKDCVFMGLISRVSQTNHRLYSLDFVWFDSNELDIMVIDSLLRPWEV